MNTGTILTIATVVAVVLGSPASAEPVRYFHDELSRLVRVEYPDGTAVNYGYDAVGNRIARLACLDVDFDTLCTADDNCPDAANTEQEDLDDDLVGDICDNCVETANGDQANDDGDARGNVCDCLPADGTAFSVPSEVAEVSFTSKALLAWDSDAARSGVGTRYQVLRGDLSELPVGGGASETCLEADSADTTSEDTAEPLESEGFYYLVRGHNPCGIGVYGFESAGAERISATCP